ncbi:hypothetical protein ACJ73_05584 [Blastomyces percursus]|uniref:Dynactin subunit 6 n=1 Tax=Blastomyces percursus TaxID=1658174 RepID=A0A1J9Q3E0_9EURO|nr:hypothetical protein ACJ73_05584 [Blastomyces percursus]
MSANPAHLKPSSSRHSSSQKPPTPSYKPPVTAHPSTTIPESASFQGIHPISIGACTVIHPRTKFLSFEGPIKIGSGCIIGEKSIIGGPQTSPTSSTSPTAAAVIDAGSFTTATAATTTILENSVLIGPLTTISAGTHISSAAIVDTAAVLGRRVRVGQHAKVCPSCCIPDDGTVGNWIVIWGGSSGNIGAGGCRLQRRKRANGQAQQHNSDEAGLGFGIGGAVVEKGRLGVLEKEREGLVKLVGAGGIGGGGRMR